jgi:hypothetical protein
MGADNNKAAGAYFADPQVERLLDLVLQLTVELNAANQRQRVLELLLVSRGVLDAGAVDGFQPDEAQRAELDRTRDELLGRWLRPIVETGSPAAPLRTEWFAALGAPLP